MNIKILDSWLREYVKTDAKPKDIAHDLSLTSVSIERTEKWHDELLFDIEVTTNRPDLMSVIGLARECAAVLPQFGTKASFVQPSYSKPEIPRDNRVAINIKNDPKLVDRVCAVVMEVTVRPSPKLIQDRLESTDIRSLNNVIDVTNYVMRTIGHPTHVFDFDRLNSETLTIRESKKGEEIETLDGKKYALPGGDIIAVDRSDRIVDLLGIMGLQNSVVTEQTKRILFFIDNIKPQKIRKTSMSLGIRSEAAQLNEKGVDPELAYNALLFGIELYKKFADGKIASDIIDIYPNKPTQKTIRVSEEKIATVIGIPVPLTKAEKILTTLGFGVSSAKNVLTATVPSWRVGEMDIPEDLIEEIARINGYHTLPSILPPIVSDEPLQISKDPFFWETRVKHTLKYWGFTEVYTYSMVSEELLEGPMNEAVILRNPLDEEHVYMRRTLVPSLLEVLRENKAQKTLQLFEIANVYEKNGSGLPNEKRMLAGILKKPKLSFYDVKGIVEQIGTDLGITFTFRPAKESLGADVFIGKTTIGSIEELAVDTVDFELDFEAIAANATLKKTFTPLHKYPAITEDLALNIAGEIATGEIMETIKKVSPLVREVSLLDKYKETRTFHIVYRSEEKNLSNDEVGEIRQKIINVFQKKK